MHMPAATATIRKLFQRQASLASNNTVQTGIFPQRVRDFAKWQIPIKGKGLAIELESRPRKAESTCEETPFAKAMADITAIALRPMAASATVPA